MSVGRNGDVGEGQQENSEVLAFGEGAGDQETGEEDEGADVAADPPGHLDAGGGVSLDDLSEAMPAVEGGLSTAIGDALDAYGDPTAGAESPAGAERPDEEGWDPTDFKEVEAADPAGTESSGDFFLDG